MSINEEVITDYLELLYKTILRRKPDKDGWNIFYNYLRNNGTKGFKDVLFWFTELPEYKHYNPVDIYDQDGLRSLHSSEFMKDEKFLEAYKRGLKASKGVDYQWHWRVHVGLWVADNCKNLDGDFVEFGVNVGFMSSAIMKYLDWNSKNKTFYLLDTFQGIDEKYLLKDEIVEGILNKNEARINNNFYTTSVESVKANFYEWERIKIIEGSVPDTLSLIDSHEFAFAHIDMNCARPEVAALEFIWPKLKKGGMILLDDYAYRGFHNQKKAIDNLGNKLGLSILSMPTGQGLIIK